MSKKALIVMVLFSLLLIILSLYTINMLDPGEKAKPMSEVINVPANNIIIDQDFKLISDDGKDFDYNNLKGKYSLVYLGFSYCPDVCPTVIQKLAEVSKMIDEKDLERVQFIFVSVDPERDTLQTLKAFVSQFGDKIKGVTGKKEEIDKLVSSLKGYYAKIDNKDDAENYYVDHSSFVYLLDPNANMVTQFTMSASAKEIADNLQSKLK